MTFSKRAPDTSKIKSKLHYANSKPRLFEQLEGIEFEITANDLEDIKKEDLTKKCLELDKK